MEIEEYIEIFRALEIPIRSLPENYTPEEYGRSLLSTLKSACGVSYAAATEYVEINSNINSISKDRS